MFQLITLSNISSLGFLLRDWKIENTLCHVGSEVTCLSKIKIIHLVIKVGKYSYIYFHHKTECFHFIVSVTAEKVEQRNVTSYITFMCLCAGTMKKEVENKGKCFNYSFSNYYPKFACFPFFLCENTVS